LTRWLAIPLAVVIALYGAPVSTQMVCGDYASMTIQLATPYGETRRGLGVSGNTLFEVWRSEDTGTWTILQVYPNGVACVIAVGENWKDAPPAPQGDPA